MFLIDKPEKFSTGTSYIINLRVARHNMSTKF